MHSPQMFDYDNSFCEILDVFGTISVLSLHGLELINPTKKVVRELLHCMQFWNNVLFKLSKSGIFLVLSRSTGVFLFISIVKICYYPFKYVHNITDFTGHGATKVNQFEYRITLSLEKNKRVLQSDPKCPLKRHSERLL